MSQEKIDWAATVVLFICLADYTERISVDLLLITYPPFIQKFTPKYSYNEFNVFNAVEIRKWNCFTF